mmetsp:Transcript_24245/g.72845  ORF Transcript_24245/g.72845 Transcript_24245/m.72845 type:complete len:232 (+) Transcript_24245:1111-1806(+)
MVAAIDEVVIPSVRWHESALGHTHVRHEPREVLAGLVGPELLGDDGIDPVGGHDQVVPPSGPVLEAELDVVGALADVAEARAEAHRAWRDALQEDVLQSLAHDPRPQVIILDHGDLAAVAHALEGPPRARRHGLDLPEQAERLEHAQGAALLRGPAADVPTADLHLCPLLEHLHALEALQLESSCEGEAADPAADDCDAGGSIEGGDIPGSHGVALEGLGAPSGNGATEVL